MPQYEANHEQLQQERWSLLEQVNVLTEKPMIVLSFVWLGLLIVDLTSGLRPLLQTVSTVIWGLFAVDFAIEFMIAPRKLAYLKRNWLTVVSLLLPALRIVRVFRVLRAVRAVRSLSLIRVVTSLNRSMRAVGTTLGRRGIGYVIAVTVIITFGGAAGMYAFESPRALREAGLVEVMNDSGLSSYGESVWWTAMIMTTMGSEYWPRTAEGRILGWLLAVYAFAIFGYITATIASYFIGQDTAVIQQTTAETGANVDATALQAEMVALRAQLAQLRAQLPVPARSPQDDHP